MMERGVELDMVHIGLIQLKVSESKEENLIKAEEMIKEVVNGGAEIVVLPEMFNCPYEATIFPEYAEKEGGHTWANLSRIARENNIYLIGGSIPEKDEQENVYNTSYIFDPNGQQIGKHRKMHLFDIDIEGGQRFKESDTLTPGDAVTVFDTLYGKIGVMICYDLRFPELARLMVQKGAKLIIVPGAFNMTTGPAHWEILFRTRALDNQVYAIGVAPARDEGSNYVSYGNSIIVNPWGEMINHLGKEEGTLVQELDLAFIDKTRRELPLLKHIRRDLYSLKEETKRISGIH